MLLSRRCMYHSFFRIVGGVAFLLNLPQPAAFARHLRQEASAYRAQGYEAQRHGDPATALTFYQKAIVLDPMYAAPHNDLGILLEEAGRVEEAQRSYHRALVLDPTYVDAHANLAMLYERLGQRDQAIYHWLKRYELGHPQDPWTLRAKERLTEAGLGPLLEGAQQVSSIQRVFDLLPSLNAMQDAAARARADANATYQPVVDQEFLSHAQSIKEFRAVTSEHGEWHR